MKKIILGLTILLSSSVVAQTAVITDSIFSGGISRYYALYVPAIYNSANAVPLIFNIHGGTGSGSQQMEFGNFKPIADTANFIVVSPTGLISPSQFGAPSNSWSLDWTTPEGIVNKEFLFSLLDTLRSQYNIDSNRVYATGFSQGAAMSYNMACFDNINFAGFGIVAGSFKTPVSETCSPRRPTPVCVIHGTTDPIATYDGSASLFSSDVDIHVDTAVKYWVDYNQCNPIPTFKNLTNSDTTDGSTVEHYVYSDGRQGVSVEFYRVINGGHSWPAIDSTGGTTSPTAGNTMTVGNRNRDFDASKELWRFFSQKSLLTGIKKVSGNNSFVSVFPNPSNGIFTLKLDNQSHAKLQVFNSLGENIYEESITQQSTQINLSTLPTGVYFYMAINHNGEVDSGNLIIH